MMRLITPLPYLLQYQCLFIRRSRAVPSGNRSSLLRPPRIFQCESIKKKGRRAEPKRLPWPKPDQSDMWGGSL